MTEEEIEALIDSRIKQERMGRALTVVQIAVERALSSGLDFRDLERIIPIATMRISGRKINVKITEVSNDQ